jgi:hypothetical protein
MQAMHNLAPEHQTPGEHGIKVHWVKITGDFGEGQLIVRSKYTLCRHKKSRPENLRVIIQNL